MCNYCARKYLKGLTMKKIIMLALFLLPQTCFATVIGISNVKVVEIAAYDD
jgi:hypothetical protein